MTISSGAAHEDTPKSTNSPLGRGPNGRCNPRAALTVLNDPPTTLRRKFRLNVVAMERAEAAYTVLEDNENFATADLQAQFVRGAKVGFLKALGRVVRRTRQPRSTVGPTALAASPRSWSHRIPRGCATVRSSKKLSRSR